MEKSYNNPINLTSQFVHCGNSFRADTYKFCSFNCKYCFANNRKGGHSKQYGYKLMPQKADLKIIQRLFEDAFEKNKITNIKKELLQRKIPLHLGGMSDPFQHREWIDRITYQFFEITNKYQYPIIVSTKTSNLPDEYFKILNPKIHTFQISIMGYSDEYINKFEGNTQTAKQRIEFVKELKKRGFWVSIRIQPIINIDEAIELIKKTEQFVDFYTIEHLKLPTDNSTKFKEITSLINENIKITKNGLHYLISPETKIKNIETIKKTTKIKIGVGDNDLRLLSDTCNCCGVDCMPNSFSNWLKYNSMTIKMTGNRNTYIPYFLNEDINAELLIPGFSNKDYVEKDYLKKYGCDNQLKLF